DGKAYVDEGAIRFKVPPGQTRFDDLVHGPVKFENEHTENFVILRSAGHPTYHLSVVVDDVDMAMTHVVRGDDHISNTPKQILLYRAFGAAVPQFAHVPLILGPDKKRLSKRHGATSVMEYHRLGYLPEALVNFLVLLGWSPGDDRELMTRDELIAAFALEGISGGNAVFNPEKLDWFNQQYIMRLPIADLARRVEPWLREAGLWSADLTSRQDWLYRLLELVRPRVKKMDQFANELGPFLGSSVEFEPAAVAKHLAQPAITPGFHAFAQLLEAANPFDSATLEPALRRLAESRGVKAAALIHA